MSKRVSIIFVLIIFIFSLSCRRQKLEDTYRFIAHMPITIDWSKSLLKESRIANVAICAYPEDGGKPISILSDNIYFNVLKLPIGEYDILIYNELLGDVKGLESDNADDFNNVLSHIIPIENPKILFDTLRMNEIVAEHHDRISTWAMRDLVVTPEMVELTRSDEYAQYINESISKTKALLHDESSKSEDIKLPTLPHVETTTGSITELKSATEAIENLSKVSPQCENTVLHFNVRVGNLNNAMKIEALLRGMEYGAYLSSDKRESIEDKNIVYESIVNNRIYDNPTNGIHGYFNLIVNTFGAGACDKYYLDLCFALNDGKVLKFSYDITSYILEGGKSKYITIDLGSIEDPAIMLPPCRDAGFNVDDWDDEIIVDIL